MNFTVLDQANAIAEAALAILKQWGTHNDSVFEVRTDFGSIQLQYSVIRIGPKFHNSSSDWITLNGCVSHNPNDWKEIIGFKVTSVEGNPDYADRFVIALAQHFVSAPFLSDKHASIGRMKRVAAAINGDDKK